MCNIQIYVGTYKKYNEGSLYGAWLNLSNYTNYQELLNAICSLHSDEEDPEFMIQDFEAHSLYADFGLISESGLDKTIYSTINSIEDSSFELEVIEAYSECQSFSNIEELLTSLEDCYSGHYDSDESFVQELLEECGTIPQELPNYVHIDWTSTARDIMMDYSTSNGHYFRAH